MSGIKKTYHFGFVISFLSLDKFNNIMSGIYFLNSQFPSKLRCLGQSACKNAEKTIFLLSPIFYFVRKVVFSSRLCPNFKHSICREEFKLKGNIDVLSLKLNIEFFGVLLETKFFHSQNLPIYFSFFVKHTS